MELGVRRRVIGSEPLVEGCAGRIDEADPVVPGDDRVRAGTLGCFLLRNGCGGGLVLGVRRRVVVTVIVAGWRDRWGHGQSSRDRHGRDGRRSEQRDRGRRVQRARHSAEIVRRPVVAERQRHGKGEHGDGGDGANAQQPLVDAERTRHDRFRLHPTVVTVVRELRTVEVVEVIDRLERFGRRRVATCDHPMLSCPLDACHGFARSSVLVEKRSRESYRVVTKPQQRVGTATSDDVPLIHRDRSATTDSSQRPCTSRRRSSRSSAHRGAGWLTSPRSDRGTNGWR